MKSLNNSKINSEKEEFNATLKISTITKWMIFGGFIGVIIANFLPGNNYCTIIKSTIETLSTTIFSAGLVSVIVEISTIKNLVSHAFKNLLSGNFALDGLSKEALIRLKESVTLKILDNDNKDLSNTPYKYEKNLLDLINEKYYEHHNITYHITPDENNNCFHVKTKLDYTIVNKNLIDNNFEVRLKLYKMFGTNNNIVSNNFSVSVKINKQDIDINDILSIEPITHQGESAYYDSKIIIFKELHGVKNKIKAEINYDVPLFDICQSFKISAPCKNIEHKFYINKDIQTGCEWTIKANAYSTFYHRQDDDDSNYKVEQNVDDSLIIRYTNWALVGNGYCVFYQKKH